MAISQSDICLSNILCLTNTLGSPTLGARAPYTLQASWLVIKGAPDAPDGASVEHLVKTHKLFLISTSTYTTL